MTPKEHAEIIINELRNNPERLDKMVSNVFDKHTDEALFGKGEQQLEAAKLCMFSVMLRDTILQPDEMPVINFKVNSEV